MARYLAKVRSTLQQFTEWTIEKIKRADNRHADALAGIAASLPIKEAILLPIYVQANPSVAENSTCNTIEATQTDNQEWTQDIAKYIRTGTLPKDLKQAHKIRVQAARFTLIGGHLYKRSFTGPYLRCLGHTEAQYVLAELHEGICGNHMGGRSLAHRAHSQGYYWPTMKKDAAAYVQKCDKCQRYAPIPHVPSAALKSVSSPWPFAQWGMDIVGPLPAAPAQKKFLLVATDYFSKWVEAEAYASIKDKDVTKFHCIQEFLFGIEYPEFILHATLSSKQWPGGSHKQNFNQCLEEKAGASQRKVGGGATRRPMGLSNHTRTTNRKYPFALTYGMDAVIPTEIGLPTIRTDAAKQKDANTELGRNLDWADEVRESASIRMADYQQRASAHYNRKVRPRNFKNGTLVLRKVFENTAEVGAGKFQANWEGPYIVTKANENGAYHLQKLDGTPLLRPWNVFNLKQYYQ
ncbi:hypothetical protein CK203_062360 [Vitis vinifera]|uniref:Integrase zinc-binding domain-containing protein n=1 Tax=Vitis vinifera TaxID=29760 RepID=A0A438G5T5_VITVI|nr:hypothetical protein CK203_062360 [Vitis vinifera]